MNPQQGGGSHRGLNSGMLQKTCEGCYQTIVCTYATMFKGIITSTTKFMSTLTTFEMHTATSRKIVTKFTFWTI